MRISVMVGSTRSEKAKVENEERETAENMVCKLSIVITIMKYHSNSKPKESFHEGEASKGS